MVTRIPDPLHLSHLPTPIEPLGRLGSKLGLPDLWIKRDDLTGLAGGGTKARKLDYILAEALAARADVVVATGTVQSNQVRLVAGAARRVGLRAVLLLTGDAAQSSTGNLVLSQVYGAELRFLGPVGPFELQAAVRREVQACRDSGRRAHVISSASALDCVAYAGAINEVVGQLAANGREPGVIVVAAGTGATLAGFTLGARILGHPLAILGVSVADSTNVCRTRCARLATEAATAVGHPWRPEPEEFAVLDDWVGPAYGIPTAGSLAAVKDVAELEGILLEPIYTGKAMAGLMALAKDPRVVGTTVVFWHTGGLPLLFSGSSYPALAVPK